MSSVREISEQLAAAEEALRCFCQENAGLLAVVIGKKQLHQCLRVKETQAVLELTSLVREFGEAVNTAFDRPETREQAKRAVDKWNGNVQKGV